MVEPKGSILRNKKKGNEKGEHKWTMKGKNKETETRNEREK